MSVARIVAGATLTFAAAFTATYTFTNRKRRESALDGTDTSIGSKRVGGVGGNAHDTPRNAGGGSGGGGGGGGGGASPAAPLTRSFRERRFDCLAPDYDRLVDRDERWLGITRLRKRLADYAIGDTVEFAIGTGKNLPHLAAKRKAHITSLTAIDTSQNMLEICQRRHKELFAQDTEDVEAAAAASSSSSPSSQPASSSSSSSPSTPPMKLRVLCGDALEMLRTLPSNSFDTGIDTFGLCSVPEPHLVLRELRRVVRPGGAILLLEHGTSRYEWFNAMILNPRAQEHARKWGCYFNRDIDAICAKAGLGDPVERKEAQFGTTKFLVYRNTEDN